MNGRALAGRWYETEVGPRLADLPHGAALLGEGSEVLGFDDEVSPDHDFGARCQVFLESRDLGRARHRLRDLPTSFEGFSTERTEITTARRFFTDRLAFDPADGVGLADWLLTPTQVLAGLTADGVLRSSAELDVRRAALAWYPDDLWRYVLAAGWLKIAQEQAFLGRTGAVGDDHGSRVLAARLARELVRLAFLTERRWAPYAKWLGTGFVRLPIATGLHDQLQRALAADDWREREQAVVAAGSVLVSATNGLELAPRVDPTPRPYFARAIQVVDADAMVAGLLAAISDPEVRALVDRCEGRLPGSVDQACDSTDVLSDVRRARRAASVLMVD